MRFCHGPLLHCNFLAPRLPFSVLVFFGPPCLVQRQCSLYGSHLLSFHLLLYYVIATLFATSSLWYISLCCFAYVTRFSLKNVIFLLLMYPTIHNLNDGFFISQFESHDFITLVRTCSTSLCLPESLKVKIKQMRLHVLPDVFLSSA